MHAIFFGVKRVHIETLRLTQHMIRFSALTPARYDLMRVVHLHPFGIHQSTVRWLLGVTAPVVSRMLASLQELGFVEREKDVKDRRCRIVRLTERGQIALRVAKGATLENQEAERTAARVVTGDTRLGSESEAETKATVASARQDVASFDSFLLTIRHALLDRAPYHHPWQKPPFSMPDTFAALASLRLQHDPWHAPPYATHYA